MKRTLLIATLIFISCAVAPAQDSRGGARAGAGAAASARAGDELQIASGTRLTAELQQTLDVRKARVGDEVVLKTTEAIKSGGRTLAGKGARLIGHVTEVRQRAKGDAESRVSIVFDRLESGSLAAPVLALRYSTRTARRSTMALQIRTK